MTKASEKKRVVEEETPTSLAADGVREDTGSKDEEVQTDLNPTLTEEKRSSQASTEMDTGEKPGGTLDLDRLKLSQDFGASIGVKKATIMVPVRKPNRQEFIRVNPDESYQYQTGVLELKEERETYLVDPDLWDELWGEIVPKILLTTINRQGVLTLWPIKLPGEDGRLDNWNMSAMEAATLAKETWVRVAANMSLGGYEAFKASGDLPEPEWPDMPMQGIMDVAFKGRYIKSMDHLVIRRLQGAL